MSSKAEKPRSFFPSINLMILGPSRVGKTSLQRRLAKIHPSEPELFYTSTYDRQLNIGNPYPLCVTIWDFNGGNAFKSWLCKASIALFLFDISKKETFEEIKNLLNSAKLFKVYKVPIVLIGNKSDLEECREVASIDVQEWCDEIGIVDYFEISTKNGVFCEDLLEEVAQYGLKRELERCVDNNLFEKGVSLRKLLSETQEKPQLINYTEEEIHI